MQVMACTEANYGLHLIDQAGGFCSRTYSNSHQKITLYKDLVTASQRKDQIFNNAQKLNITILRHQQTLFRLVQQTISHAEACIK